MLLEKRLLELSNVELGESWNIEHHRLASFNVFLDCFGSRLCILCAWEYFGNSITPIICNFTHIWSFHP
jgi:hypothetical protein